MQFVIGSLAAASRKLLRARFLSSLLPTLNLSGVR
jgi:hypothetical protein